MTTPPSDKDEAPIPRSPARRAETKAPPPIKTTDGGANDASDQDTPGRPKSSSSRQQTHPNQDAQTGSPELDSQGTRKPAG